MDRLGLRLLHANCVQHRILLPALGVRAQSHDAEVVGDAAADPELDFLARRDALLRIGMQAGQVYRLMRGNSCSSPGFPGTGAVGPGSLASFR